MNKTVLHIISLILMVFFIAACQQEPKNQMLLFLENEEGIDPYMTRIIITPEFMRFDEGDQSKSFLLVDRKNKVAHSVNHDLKTIMRVTTQDVKVTPPMELNYTVNELDDLQDAPAINDSKPRHRQLLTNGEVCLDVISVEGLMPEAVAALREYHRILASDSAVTFNVMPADMHEPCSISMSTFAPTRHLEYGFPIQEWKPGYTRSLENYDADYEYNPALLTLPGDYFSYSVQDYREGRVDFDNRKVLSEDQQIAPQAGNTVPTEEVEVQPETKPQE